MDRFNAVSNSSHSSTSYLWQAYASFAGLLSLLIVIGNGMTILAVWRMEFLKTITNKFIVSLAVADILSAYSLVVSAIGRVPVVRNIFSLEFVCLSIAIMMPLSFLMSLLSINMIAMDRFIYIIYSLHYNRVLTPRRADMIIVLSWIFGMTFSVLVVGLVVWWYGRDGQVCEFGSQIAKRRMIAPFVICLIIYVITLVYYWKIFQVALRQRRSIRSLHSNFQRMMTSSDLNFMKVMFSVVGVCTLFWLPFVIVSFINMFYQTSHGVVAARYLGNLLYVNGAVNIFVYAAWDKKFRLAYKRLLCLQ